MIGIDVVDRDMVSHRLEAPTDMGLSLMELLKANELEVEGTCGGMALCASCHVYIESDHNLGERNDDEENMLDEAFFVKDNSRLSCQVRLVERLDGLKVRLAPVG